jgi:hypothetical protein
MYKRPPAIASHEDGPRQLTYCRSAASGTKRDDETTKLGAATALKRDCRTAKLTYGEACSWPACG